jgi:hypothetical protein
LPPLIEAGQAKWRCVGPEMADWMRVEGRHDDRPPLVGAALHCPANHRLVAEVKSIEITERDDCSAQVFGNRLVAGQSLHYEAA